MTWLISQWWIFALWGLTGCALVSSGRKWQRARAAALEKERIAHLERQRDPLFIEAAREVDAMLPGTEPIAPRVVVNSRALTPSLREHDEETKRFLRQMDGMVNAAQAQLSNAYQARLANAAAPIGSREWSMQQYGFARDPQAREYRHPDGRFVSEHVVSLEGVPRALQLVNGGQVAAKRN